MLLFIAAFFLQQSFDKRFKCKECQKEIRKLDREDTERDSKVWDITYNRFRTHIFLTVYSTLDSFFRYANCLLNERAYYGRHIMRVAQYHSLSIINVQLSHEEAWALTYTELYFFFYTILRRNRRMELHNDKLHNSYSTVVTIRYIKQIR